MPSVPSLPTNTAEKIVAGRIQRGPPRSTTSPAGEDDSAAPRTWFTVNPYFRQCAPPEFSATFPPMVHTICEEGSGA